MGSPASRSNDPFHPSRHTPQSFWERIRYHFNWALDDIVRYTSLDDRYNQPVVIVLGWTILVTLVVLAAAPFEVWSPYPRLSSDLEILRSRVDSAGLAVAVARNGQIEFAQGLGVKNAKGDPVDAETAFYIGSTTKAFTSFLAALQVSNGNLSWTEPVHHYAPHISFSDPFLTERATLLDLLSHRTGLPRYDIFNQVARNTDELLAVVPHLKLKADFRTDYIYNNIMFALSGTIAAKAAGHDSWKSYADSLLATLELNNTRTSPSEFDALPNRADPYISNGTYFPETANDELATAGGAGAISSNVLDLSRWAQFLLGGARLANGSTLVKPKDLEILFTPRNIVPVDAGSPLTSYALGWQISTYRGTPVWSHYGQAYGFTTAVCLYPAHNTSVVVLSNQLQRSVVVVCPMAADRVLFGEKHLRPSRHIDQAVAAQTAERVALEKEIEERYSKRASGTTPTLPLKEYVGKYQSELGTIEIAKSKTADGKQSLRMVFGNFKAELAHWQYDEYILQGDLKLGELADGLVVLKFAVDSDKVTAASFLVEPTMDFVAFERV
ncbi:beta-lactamase/transpeptidase-like protein [Polychytrium aggregatum]|uniref:beta-lactamase/transpeptidase-like protein n=1 Tax=Polychytrium aggregatum TaxID=110093 RepID=UPI0022FE1006|nr:beta-lactamase/transpeptidase-like protein [Polychytrium aggregatum]KAI9204910.1 beta-lactamase/transpeptidase-like protein [Polychytrium aggregatum]